MARPTNPLLNSQLIVETAVAIVDAEGAGALSTRRLARELGVSSPSLYHHFRTKDELLDAVSDHIAGQVRHEHCSTWQDVLRDFAYSYRATMAAHPNAVGFMALRPIHHRSALASYEWQLRALTGMGWDVGFSWEVVMSVDQLVLGAALQSGGPELILSDESLRDEFPLLAKAGDLGRVQPGSDRTFARTIEDLIAGLELRLQREPRPA
ncbi:MAG: TetR family transcriptional regulator [Conexibacter sp.]